MTTIHDARTTNAGWFPAPSSFVNVDDDVAGMYDNVWGLNGNDQQERLREYSDLRHIKAGDQDYDLADPKAMQAFLRDLSDGHLDGVAGDADPGLTVTIEEGKIHVNGATYDLHEAADRHAMLRDAHDGSFNGEVGDSLGTTKAKAADSTESDSDAQKVPNNTKDVPASAKSATSGGEGTSDGTASASAKDTKDAVGWVNSHDANAISKAIRDGSIPDSVAGNDKAMMLLQEKQQDHQRMIALMSSMLKLEHDTLMAIIQNMPK